MTTLERSEANLAWDFRRYWWKRTVVKVVLTERCLMSTVVGKVSHVAVTGAFAVVDGWHVPMEDVLRVERATVEDKDLYARADQGDTNDR